MGKKDIRVKSIVEELNKNPDIMIKDLAEKYDVSEMTIRRDLDYIKTKNLLENGGNSTNLVLNSEYIFYSEQINHLDQKERIAQFAISLIEPDDTLILDNGTTTSVLAKYIPREKNVTVLCYNYQVLSQLQSNGNASIIFAGGYYHPSDQMFDSDEGVSLIKRIRATKMFVSASGIHKSLGLTCANNYEVATKRAALTSSHIKILIADSSKFGAIRPGFFAELGDIDIIVTDDELDKDWVQSIRELGIKLYLV